MRKDEKTGLHADAFEYLKPTGEELDRMGRVRALFADLAAGLASELPAGPDADHVMRKIREAAMWANTSITRDADGSPRVAR